MKTLLLFLFLASSVHAQNFVVRWTGDNTNGTPYYWPIVVRSVGSQKTIAGEVVLSTEQLDQCVKTNQSAFVKERVEIQATVTTAELAAKQELTEVKSANDRLILLIKELILATEQTEDKAILDVIAKFKKELGL